MDSNNPIKQFDHFIPVSTARLIKSLDKTRLDEHRIDVIYKLKTILTWQFQQKLSNLKQQYQPFNPDRELAMQEPREKNMDSCIDEIRNVLLSANYCELNQQQIAYALQKTSPYGLDISIDFSAFSTISLFYRGKSASTIDIRDWKTLYTKKKSVNLIKYQRLCLLLAYRDADSKPGLQLKLFKDILRPDLEMLFPECRVHMKVFDKIKLAITGGGGTAGGIFATIGKISTAVSPWTIAVAIGGFAMLLWRQVSKIFIQKTRYMATLAQNLYFHNLDNNAGAISYLVDQASQEEIKETILAYALINLHNIDSKDELDRACEHWFEQQFDIAIDFDVSDAVRKLERLGVIQTNQSNLVCYPASQISTQLEKKWLDFFQQN